MPEKFDMEGNDSTYLSKCEYIRSLVWSIACVILSAVDVGSDMYLGCIYFLNNQYLYGGLTLLFVYLASFTSVCEFYRTDTFKKQKPFTRWIILISLLTTSCSGVAIGIYDFWKKSKRKKDYTLTKKMIQQKYHEACVEAAPQLILQIYFMLDNVQELQNFNVSLLVNISCEEALCIYLVDFFIQVHVQRISIISSLIAIIVAFCKIYIEDRGVEGPCNIFIFYISVLLTIGPRILGLAILFNLYPYYTLPVLIIQGAVHIILYWILEGQTNWIMLSFVPLASIIFTWLPLAVTNKWYQILTYSVCVVVQNFTASLLWITERRDTFLYDLVAVLCFYPYIVGLFLSSLMFHRNPKI